MPEKALNRRVTVSTVDGESYYLYPRSDEEAKDLINDFAAKKDFVSSQTYINADHVVRVTLYTWEKKDD